MKTLTHCFYCQIKFFLLIFIFCTGVHTFSQTGGRGAEPQFVLEGTQYNKVYALVIGISNYQQVPKLSFAVDDAILMTQILEMNFPASKINIEHLYNDTATEINILRGLKSLYSKAGEGDLAILYFAGHGDVATVVDEQSGFFLAYNASDSREYDLGGAVSFEVVNKYINAIIKNKAKVWLITDACRSGRIINQSGAASTMASLNQGFLNTTKFISCQSHELSYEDSTLMHGAFTYFLTKALSGIADKDGNGLLNVDELNTYLKDTVRVYTNKRQTPKISSANEFDDIFVANSQYLALLGKGRLTGNSYTSRNVSGGGGTGKKSPQLLEVEDAISKGDLYGNTGSAKDLLEKAKQNKAIPKAEVELMQKLLVDALLERGQRISNLFLTGRPTIAKNEALGTAKLDFKLAAEMIGADEPYHNKLLQRSAFFEAVEIVQQAKVSEYPRAEQILQNLAKEEPNSAFVNQGLAMLYIAQSKKKEAESELAKAESKITTWTKPKNTGAYLNILAGKLDEALKQIEKSTALSSDPYEISKLKVKLYTANLELQTAVNELNKFENKESAEYYALMGQIDMLRGRITKAETWYKKALEKDVDDVEIIKQLAELYKKDLDSVQSSYYYEKALKIEPDNASLSVNLAAMTGEIAKITTTGINYYNIPEVIQIAKKYSSGGDYDTAIEILKKALEISDWNPDLHAEYGNVLFKSGKKTDAEASWKSALERSPYHFESIKSLVNSYISQRKKIEADALIKKHDGYFEGSAKWQAFKFDAYREIGSQSNLLSILEHAKKLDSLDTDIYRSLYKLYVDNDDYLRAKSEFRHIIDLGGQHKDTLDFINKVNERVNYQISRGNYDKTVDGLKLILDIDPFDLVSIFYLTKSTYMMGDYRTAMKYSNTYEKYLLFLPALSQMEYYSLKGNILLELGYYREAEEMYKLANSKAIKPSYLGLAMAQFEQGKETWLDNFRRVGPHYTMRSEFLKYFNQQALKRLEKMEKKAR